MFDELRAYYFGCWGQTGHYLYEPSGRTTWNRITPNIHGGSLDGGFCGDPALARYRYGETVPTWSHEGAQPEGRARITHLDGWTILAFWDRSLDRRDASNSAFLLQGTHDFQAMVAMASARFPSVWKRITDAFPVGPIDV